MAKQIRTSILWLLIAVCYLLHNTYHLSEPFFGIDIKLPAATGSVPVIVHLFRIVVELITIVLALITLYSQRKGFLWYCFIWSILLGLLNAVHLAETIVQEPGEISQLALLTLILIINILLIVDSRKRIYEIA